MAERRTISVLRLASLIGRLGPEFEIVHFLKIDAQGADIEVFQSLQGLKQRCLFVQTESVVVESAERDTRLYVGQSHFSRDLDVFRADGFRVLNVASFGITPEADVIFINVALLRRLLPQLAPRA